MQIVFATANAIVKAGGGTVQVVAGQHWPANDPVVKAYPSLFTDDVTVGLRVSVPLDDTEDEDTRMDQEWAAASKLMAETGHTPESALAAVQAADAPKPSKTEEAADASESEAPVEQATKAPGEKRQTRRRG